MWVRYPTLNTKLVSCGSAEADPQLQSSIDMYKGFVRVSFFFLPLFVIKTKLLSVYHHPYYGIDHLWPGLAPAIYTSISDSRTPCPCHGIRDVFYLPERRNQRCFIRQAKVNFLNIYRKITEKHDFSAQYRAKIAYKNITKKPCKTRFFVVYTSGQNGFERRRTSGRT